MRLSFREIIEAVCPKGGQTACDPGGIDLAAIGTNEPTNVQVIDLRRLRLTNDQARAGRRQLDGRLRGQHTIRSDDFKFRL